MYKAKLLWVVRRNATRNNFLKFKQLRIWCQFDYSYIAFRTVGIRRKSRAMWAHVKDKRSPSVLLAYAGWGEVSEQFFASGWSILVKIRDGHGEGLTG